MYICILIGEWLKQGPEVPEVPHTNRSRSHLYLAILFSYRHSLTCHCALPTGRERDIPATRLEIIRSIKNFFEVDGIAIRLSSRHGRARK
jgi:hypothetical protein